ncbi:MULTISPECIES: hypothetical protein [unclassified Methanoculleus]|uniref:hypothetical protein n=1 Tax=unclassified Methanoculleus TaxID=2619537 RepID=UPI0025F78FCE|nr:MULTISPECIES: hypothetical protein [unclassified Methanoculleus]
MISQERFEFIKEKYGCYASWAIWADAGEKPKDNIGDLSVFDLKHNSGLLEQLNPDIILVGLNISRGRMKYPLANFHDARPEAMDFKIRYTLRSSPFWGAYMTDIIKDFDQKVSGKVRSYLRTHKQFEIENAKLFHEEIIDVATHNPTIIAFGDVAYRILMRNFMDEYKILKVPHYSIYCSKEKYRENVGRILQYE